MIEAAAAVALAASVFALLITAVVDVWSGDYKSAMQYSSIAVLLSALLYAAFGGELSVGFLLASAVLAVFSAAARLLT